MRKAILLFTLLIIATFFYAATIPRERHRVKKIINYLTRDTTEYFYNPDGHVAKIHSSKGNNVTYEYSKGTILKRYNDVMRGLTFVDTMTLNKDGLVDRLSSNNPGTRQETRKFNSDRFLVEAKLYDKNGNISATSGCEYQNGNQVSFVIKESSRKLMNSIIYQYYTDKINTIGNENLGSDFTGVGSKNPVKASTSHLDGSPPVALYYNYHYDEKERISTRVMFNKSGKLLDSIAYIYY